MHLSMHIQSSDLAKILITPGWLINQCYAKKNPRQIPLAHVSSRHITWRHCTCYDSLSRAVPRSWPPDKTSYNLYYNNCYWAASAAACAPNELSQPPEVRHVTFINHWLGHRITTLTHTLSSHLVVISHVYMRTDSDWLPNPPRQPSSITAEHYLYYSTSH